PGEPNPLIQVFRDKYYTDFRQRKQTTGKHDRAAKIRELREKVFAEYQPTDREPEYTPEQVARAFESLEERVVRDLTRERRRSDGRTPQALRNTSCEVGGAPRTQGAGFFARAET